MPFYGFRSDVWWNDNAVLEMMQGGENKINEGRNSIRCNMGGLWIQAATNDDLHLKSQN